MISIEVKNASEVIKNRKGWFVSRAMDVVGLSELAVEKMIADQLKTVLHEQGINVDVKVFHKSADS
ncbi:MAG: hypothetical protein OEX19_15605 [Gammaproteobacteria bacterium]|nr:hypothetical protein [Gammaproteobacteria bacterium]